ncbi:MAG: hypothetical protein JWM47_3378, partial [Acidimicrobiales bacterium]|nr:hypothetical protein [Acidimicrobiales bacterium]
MKRVIGMALWGAVVTGATVALVLVEFALWHQPPKWATLPAVIVLGLAAGGPVIRAAFLAQTARRDRQAEKVSMDAIRVALKLVATRSGIEFDRLGFNCLILPAWYRRLMRRSVRKRLFGWLSEERRSRLGERPRLRSAQKFRVQQDPPHSGIQWTRQKGVIGQCWRDRQVVGLDVRKRYEPYLGLSRTEWEANTPPSVKLGLSHGEWKLVADKYSAVLVAPIFVNG